MFRTWRAAAQEGLVPLNSRIECVEDRVKVKTHNEPRTEMDAHIVQIDQSLGTWKDPQLHRLMVRVPSCCFRFKPYNLRLSYHKSPSFDC